MKRIVICSVIFIGLALSLIGCGGNTTLNTQEMTDEQKAAIKAEDKSVADEESPGNKTLKDKKKR